MSRGGLQNRASGPDLSVRGPASSCGQSRASRRRTAAWCCQQHSTEGLVHGRPAGPAWRSDRLRRGPAVPGEPGAPRPSLIRWRTARGGAGAGHPPEDRRGTGLERARGWRRPMRNPNRGRCRRRAEPPWSGPAPAIAWPSSACWSAGWSRRSGRPARSSATRPTRGTPRRRSRQLRRPRPLRQRDRVPAPAEVPRPGSQLGDAHTACSMVALQALACRGEPGGGLARLTYLKARSGR